MKKKIIVVCAFLLLICVTIALTLIGAVESYQYDMDPKNGVDILAGFGAALLLVLGVVVVFYELDLFYTVYYFCFKPKTVVRSIFNLLSNFSLGYICVGLYIDSAFVWHKLPEVSFLIAFVLYCACRGIYLLISVFSWEEPQN